MKAPEKIYISPLPNPSDGYVGVAWDEPHKTMVEYTRTDAFIEKAERFLNEELCIRFSGNEYFVALNKAINLQEFIKNFKNYMLCK